MGVWKKGLLIDGMLVACALKEDLALLKDGDLTEVGEKGMNTLSLLFDVKLMAI